MYIPQTKTGSMPRLLRTANHMAGQGRSWLQASLLAKLLHLLLKSIMVLPNLGRIGKTVLPDHTHLKQHPARGCIHAYNQLQPQQQLQPAQKGVGADRSISLAQHSRTDTPRAAAMLCSQCAVPGVATAWDACWTDAWCCGNCHSPTPGSLHSSVSRRSPLALSTHQHTQGWCCA